MFSPVKSLGSVILLCCFSAVPAAGAKAESYFQTQKRVNAGVVRIMTGGVDDTAFRVGADLSAVLDRGDDFRVLPMMGKGSLQNVTDVLFLEGVDLAIVQADVLSYVRDRKIHRGIERRLNYITKLYNEEFHLLARKEISSVKDLAGKRVNVGINGSGSSVTATIVFQALGIDIRRTNADDALALALLREGKIDAMVSVAGKPTGLLAGVRGQEGLHFLSIPRTPGLMRDYMPGRLEPADYPGLVPEGRRIDTLSVGAVLAVFAWKPDTKRYKKVARFVETLFSNLESLQQQPRHRKWAEVNLQASIPGWNRFKAAEDWLQANATVAAADGRAYTRPELQAAFSAFLEREAPGLAKRLDRKQKDELFDRFLAWFKDKRR